MKCNKKTMALEQLHDALIEHGDEVRCELDGLSQTHVTDRTAFDFVIVALRRLMGATDMLAGSLAGNEAMKGRTRHFTAYRERLQQQEIVECPKCKRHNCPAALHPLLVSMYQPTPASLKEAITDCVDHQTKRHPLHVDPLYHGVQCGKCERHDKVGDAVEIVRRGWRLLEDGSWRCKKCLKIEDRLAVQPG